jgi:simple sugar transport system ATP-binding protein
MGSFSKDEISIDELTQLMAGGAELQALEHELEAAGTIRHEDLTTPD